jgi:hypothetical protein
MAYSIDVKEKAFQFYCQGYSFHKIAKLLKDDGTKVTERTLIKWSKQFGWKVRKQHVLKETRKVTNEKLVNELAELDSRLSVLQDDLLDELKEVRVRTKEGGVAALRQLMDLRQKLRGEKAIEENIDEIIGIIFEILAEDKVIGPKLMERQDIIVKKLDEAIRKRYGFKA